MKAYSICTPYTHSKNIVIAQNIGEAETAFLKEYGPMTILAIKLDAEYVLIADSIIKEAK